jgi:GGDEF domain-containing protein
VCERHDFKLVSRQTFEQCLEELSAECPGKQLHALLYAQLRGGSIGQDRHQDMTAEALVQHVVQLLGTDNGQHDAITLLGSEKFAVLIQDCLSECALQVARLMRTAIQNSLLWWQGDTVRFNVNIGLVLFRHYSDKIALLTVAHQACRSAKESGYNHIHVVRLD